MPFFIERRRWPIPQPVINHNEPLPFDPVPFLIFAAGIFSVSLLLACIDRYYRNQQGQRRGNPRPNVEQLERVNFAALQALPYGSV